MKASAITILIFLLLASGCEMSYRKTLSEGNTTTNGESLGIVLNAKVCLEGAFVDDSSGLQQSTTLDSSPLYFPLDSPYTNLAPWYHFSESDQTIDPLQLGSNQFVDWVLVQLYKLEDGNLVFADAQSALLHSDGTLYEPTFAMLQGLYFTNLPAGEYYINIIHRNHLAIGSADPVSLSSAYDENVYNVDFTTIVTTAPNYVDLLGAAKTMPLSSSRCLMAGDLNGDLTIDNADEVLLRDHIEDIVLGPVVGTTILGYQTPDLDLNGQSVYGNILNDSDDLDLIIGNSGSAGVINQ